MFFWKSFTKNYEINCKVCFAKTFVWICIDFGRLDPDLHLQSRSSILSSGASPEAWTPLIETYG
jgi:hypothetical protein